MASKYDLEEWVRGAVASAGGSAQIVEVAKYIWKTHGEELQESGDLFYTWQHEVPKPKGKGHKGPWRLT